MKAYSSCKYITASVAIGLIFTLLCGFVRFEAGCENIRGSVLRLHVLANSDSDADQALKLKVRDALLRVSAELFASAENLEESERIAGENLDLLRQTAERVIAENGCRDSVRVSLGRADFNTRVYENATLPAGAYDALRVVIGAGKGKNWWCVMFPPMCLPAAEKTDLSHVVEGESLEITEHGEQYEIRFKAVEIYEKIKSFFTGKA